MKHHRFLGKGWKNFLISKRPVIFFNIFMILIVYVIVVYLFNVEKIQSLLERCPKVKIWKKEKKYEQMSRKELFM